MNQGLSPVLGVEGGLLPVAYCLPLDTRPPPSTPRSRPRPSTPGTPPRQQTFREHPPVVRQVIVAEGDQLRQVRRGERKKNHDDDLPSACLISIRLIKNVAPINPAAVK